jgi:cardiolipin synthase
VGSTNLNLASWIGNRELDVVIEDEAFGCEMEGQYLKDLENTTEVVLNPRQRVRAAGDTRAKRTRGAGGSAGRAAAGALRIGNALGSALTARRLLGPAERRLTVPGGLGRPSALVGGSGPGSWPGLAAVCAWLGLALPGGPGAAGLAPSARPGTLPPPPGGQDTRIQPSCAG